MNTAAVCLVVACMLYCCSERNVAQASPTPQPDRGKTFSEFEDPDLFKRITKRLFGLKDQKDPELSFPANIYDDSESMLIAIYRVPKIIEKKKSEHRINQLFGTIPAFEESEVTTSESEQEHDGFDALGDKRGFPEYENIDNVRSVKQIINGLRGKKSEEYVCDGFDPHRGKRGLHKYENVADVRSVQQIINGLRGKKSNEYVGEGFNPLRGKRGFHEYEKGLIIKFI